MIRNVYPVRSNIKKQMQMDACHEKSKVSKCILENIERTKFKGETLVVFSYSNQSSKLLPFD
jgi:hypothetical protein